MNYATSSEIVYYSCHGNKCIHGDWTFRGGPDYTACIFSYTRILVDYNSAECIVLVRDTKNKPGHHGYVPADDRLTSLITLTMVMVLVVVVFVLFGIGIQKLWTNSGKLCVIEYDRKYTGLPRGLWGPWANIEVGPMGEVWEWN